MPAIYVCPLSRLGETVEQSGARHIVTMINTGTVVRRPESVPEDNHLFLGFNDISTPIEGMRLPGQDHMDAYLSFLERWDRGNPIVVHCFAGVSRSTAGAFTAMCFFRPDLAEKEVALRLRRASPSATPNIRLVELADASLGRSGRMVDAINEIGRGADAFEGNVFSLTIDD